MRMNELSFYTLAGQPKSPLCIRIAGPQALAELRCLLSSCLKNECALPGRDIVKKMNDAVHVSKIRI